MAKRNRIFALLMCVVLLCMCFSGTCFAQGQNFYASGVWSSDTSFNANLGQAVWITVKNANVLGTTIEISADNGQTYNLILAPFQQKTFKFTKFASEPTSWHFDVSTYSDAFIVSYTITSTWVPGMPPNP